MPEASPIVISHVVELGPELSNEVMDVARRQGEDPETVQMKIQQFRDMIYEKGGCRPHRMDDEYLKKFLRARFWKVENAYKLIVRYYQFRAQNKNFYQGVHPTKLRSTGDEEIVSVAPYRDQNGRRLIVYKIGNWRPSKLPVLDLFRATLLIMEVGSLEPANQVLGAVGIFDLEGLAMHHAWQMTPSYAQKIIQLLVTHMPIRVNAIHFINQGWVFDTVWQLFKPFLNERMREKVFMHGSDLKSLHKHVDPSRLPMRYGGTQPEYPYKRWLEKIKYNEKVLNNLEQLGYVIDPDDINAISDPEE
ncbi:alpha-tocopherol transfer protein-like [Culicoides brevitarsis]|uniref:alpha-tocopherol transfer protein-like n=1 Tax=Culicoides brevitarsis TaxID=469753 RepID=UPI00307BDC6E